MGHAVFEIVLDCADPITLAFQRVPEPRHVKNRMHADFVTGYPDERP